MHAFGKCAAFKVVFDLLDDLEELLAGLFCCSRQGAVVFWEDLDALIVPCVAAGPRLCALVVGALLVFIDGPRGLGGALGALALPGLGVRPCACQPHAWLEC